MIDYSKMTDEQLLAEYESTKDNQSNSQDYSRMSDEELLSLYQSKKSSVVPELYDISSIGSEKSVKQNQSPLDYITEPLTDVGIELVRGVYKGTAGTVDKLDAVAKLVENKTGLDADLNNSLTYASEFWKKQADALPQTDVPFKGLYNFIGETPAIMAEFAGTGGVGSMVVRSAILGGLTEYGKEAEDAALIEGAVKGAVTMGLTAGAFAAAGKGLTIAAKALQEHGPTAAKRVLKLVMPKDATPQDLDRTYTNLESYLSKQFRNKLGTSKEIENIGKMQIDDAKKIADENIYLKTQEINNELKVKQEDAKIRFDEQQLSYKDTLDALRSDNAEVRNAALVKFSEKTLANKNATIDEVTTLITGLEQKAAKIDAENSRQISNSISAISKVSPGAGIPLNNVISNISKNLKVLEKTNPGVFKIVSKEGQLALTPIRNEFKAFTDRVNGELAGLKEEFAKKGIIPLKSMLGGKEVYKNLADKEFANGNNAFGKVYSEMSNIFNPVKYADVATGGNAQLKALGEANAKYSSYIDSYKDLNNLLVPNGKPNVDRIIKALQGTSSADKQLIASVMKAEKVLPEKDRIISKLKDISNRSLSADKKYADILKKTKEATIKQEKELVRKNQEAVKRYVHLNKKLTREEATAVKDTIRNIRLTEEEKLSLMKSSLDEKLREANVVEALNAIRQPNEASLLRVLQNFGAFGALGQVASGNVIGAVPPLLAAGATSPKVVSTVALGLKKFANKAPAKLMEAKKVLSSKDIQKLIASANRD